MKHDTHTIHLPSIDREKAPGKLLVRLCTETRVLLEFVSEDLEQATTLEIWNAASKKIARMKRQFLFAYFYCGNTGKCLKTQVLHYDQASEPSLHVHQSVEGFAGQDQLKLNELENMSYQLDQALEEMDADDDINGSGYHKEWQQSKDQRYLIKVPEGYPDDRDRAIGRTICDFLEYNEVDATLLRIVGWKIMNAILIDIATTAESADDVYSDVEDLNFILESIYVCDIMIKVHVYKPFADELPFPDLNSYLQHCFQNRHPDQEQAGVTFTPDSPVTDADNAPPA